MRFKTNIRVSIQAAILIMALSLFGLTSAFAQDNPASMAPDFTAQSLEAQISALETNADLSTEQRDQIATSLRTAADRLGEATRQSERRLQFSTSIENALELQSELDKELEAARSALEAVDEPMSEMIGQDALFELEKDLISKESDLAEVETRLQGLQETLNSLTARQTTAPQELSESRAELNELQTRLNALGDGELETLSDARRKEVQARIWYRRNQIRALEQEIATLPQRQELVLGRRAVADVQSQILRKDVARISTRTGQKRVNEAREQKDGIEAEAQAIENSHPIVKTYAASNLDLAEQIVRIAGDAPGISHDTASARGWVVDIQNDLTAATRLVKQGRLDREAGETLRRLGNKSQTLDMIRRDMRETQNMVATATRQLIIAQEDLRDLSNGVFDPEVLLAEARRETPTLPDLSEEHKQSFADVIDTRRDLLRQLSTLSNVRINSVSELLTAQTELFAETQSLEALLDEHLLWVRSIPAIDFSFPKKVVKGAFKLFAPQNFSLALTELLKTAQSYFPVVLGFMLLIWLVRSLQAKIKLDVDRRSPMVGRVTEDSTWHTPVVIAAGIVNSLPLALVFALLAILYNVSNSPDLLTRGLGNAFAYLSCFSLVFGTWIRWDRKKGLFDAHFNLPDGLRRAIGRNLRWFVPVVGTTSFLIALTQDMTDEAISEGFSVFVFILTGLAMMIFSARILWTKRNELSYIVATDSPLFRFRGLISLVIIGMPLVTIGMAAAGYYESANELLTRMCLTGSLLLLTYVIYGASRRAIVVAQRQLKYNQALEKREAELQARRDKEAAEERGEDVPPPPPVNTKDIDVTTMTRQSSKLLQTIVFLGFAGLLWMIWSSLVPALSIFDAFEVWTYKSGALDVDGKPLDVAVSLWDLVQVLVIIILTFIAARNLPGFLEIFALSKLGVDAGTRYAVTTILGYVIVGAGIIIGFNKLGLQWSQLKWIATGLSVGIGFGLQKIIANFISGLIILFERPIRIGDYVTIGDQSGTVSRIQIRATTLKDLDNLEILIPNEALISERVTNWTLSSSITRLIVPVGIAYGSDTDVAREIMLKAVKELPKVLPAPSPNVLFMGFGDSSLDFEIRVFLSSFDDRVPMTHVIHTEINKALEAANIPIPFPQRDLNIINAATPTELAPQTKKSETSSEIRP